MTPKQFQKFLEENERATKEAVQTHVNGKIDEMRKDLNTYSNKHEKDMEDLRPIIEAYKGGRVFGNFIKWSAAVGVSYLALKGMLWK